MNNNLKERAHYNINWLEDNENPGLRKIGDIFDQYIGFLEASEKCDNYHTMDELYDHRTVLFAAICRIYRNRSWKSKLHSDGTGEDGWFIAGIETPYGQVTYHQKIEYWNMFVCKELPKAPLYDGHTPQQALERLKLFFFGDIINYEEDDKNGK